MAETPSSAPSFHAGKPPEPRFDAAPAPLADVRVKGPAAKGLNKRAILLGSGGGVVLVLFFAFGGFSSEKPANTLKTRPILSAPARPESAQGAVRDLPATYEEAAIGQANRQLKGQDRPGERLSEGAARLALSDAAQRSNAHDEPSMNLGRPGPAPVDRAALEAEQADRSQLFFSLRRTPGPSEDMRGQSAAPPHRLKASSNPPPTGMRGQDRALFPGAVIPASLVTAIESDSPGPVIAQVTQTVFDSATGRTPVIPQGARLIGAYTASSRHNQSRVAIMWSKIILPNGQEVALDEAGLDPSGAAGLPGKVDTHWKDLFGAASLGTLINVGVAAMDDPQLTYGGVGVMRRDPVDDAARQGVQHGAAILANRIVDRSLRTPPTIRIEAGKRLSIVVTRRIAVAQAYPSDAD